VRRVTRPSHRASIRERPRSDGTTGYSVLYLLDEGQTSVTFDDRPSAEAFQAAVKAYGPEKAMDMWGIARTVRAPAKELTVTKWVKHHIDQLTGIQPATRAKYRAYLDNDITPHLGDIPLHLLSRDDLTAWVQVLDEGAASGKTIKNKANFLSGCLNHANAEGHITRNPFTGIRLPEWKRREKTYLTHDEFALLLESVTEYWRPLVRYLVASGCRWGEATALQPADVNLEDSTVRVWQAWKQIPGGWELGPPKTKKSTRTIDIDRTVLDTLDLTGEFVFENRNHNPIRIHGFHRRVWTPALVKAKKAGLAKKPRVHDLRHTCASWLIQAGVPTAVVQAHLGHENFGTTVDTYSSVDRSNMRAAAVVIGHALS
jgi:integrase